MAKKRGKQRGYTQPFNNIQNQQKSSVVEVVPQVPAAEIKPSTVTELERFRSAWSEASGTFNIEEMQELMLIDAEEKASLIFVEKNKEATEKYEQLIKVICEHEDQIKILEKRITDLNAQLIEKEADALNIAEQIITDAKTKAEKETEHYRKILQAEKESTLKKVKEKESELHTREERISIKEKELENSKRRIETTREVLQQSMEQYSDASPQKLTEMKSLVDKYVEYIKDIQQQYAELDLKFRQIKLHEMRLGDKTAEDLMRENDELHRLLEEEKNRNNTYTSHQLREMKRAYDQEQDLINENNRLKNETMSYRQEMERLLNSNRELEVVKAQIELAHSLNNELKREINDTKNILEAQRSDVFPALMDIDKKEAANAEQASKRETVKVTLYELINHVRDYAANREKPLYYTPEDLAAFVAGLASSKLSILQGLSGTGKTSLPRVFCEAICGQFDIVTVESSWRDRNELIGYYNDFNKVFTAHEFTKHLYKANHDLYKDMLYFIVLDEMNLSRVEYYFADFLNVLEEPEKRKWLISLTATDISHISDGPIKLVEKTKLCVPKNVWFIGTANRDESTFEITDKVYDRAQVLNFSKRAAKFLPGKTYSPINISYTMLEKLFNEAQKTYKFDYAENAIVDDLEKFLINNFKIAFGNRIGEQINTFVSVYTAALKKDSVNILELNTQAIDYQIANKVLRKLERIDISNDKKFKQLLEKCYDYNLLICISIIEERLSAEG